MDNFFEAEISCRFSQAIEAIYYRWFRALTTASALIARSSDISSFRHSRGNESCRVPSFKFLIFPFKYRIKKKKFGFYRIFKESFKEMYQIYRKLSLIIRNTCNTILILRQTCLNHGLTIKKKSEFNPKII